MKKVAHLELYVIAFSPFNNSNIHALASFYTIATCNATAAFLFTSFSPFASSSVPSSYSLFPFQLRSSPVGFLFPLHLTHLFHLILPHWLYLPLLPSSAPQSLSTQSRILFHPNLRLLSFLQSPPLSPQRTFFHPFSFFSSSAASSSTPFPLPPPPRTSGSCDKACPLECGAVFSLPLSHPLPLPLPLRLPLSTHRWLHMCSIVVPVTT